MPGSLKVVTVRPGGEDWARRSPAGEEVAQVEFVLSAPPSARWQRHCHRVLFGGDGETGGRAALEFKMYLRGSSLTSALVPLARLRELAEAVHGLVERINDLCETDEGVVTSAQQVVDELRSR